MTELIKTPENWTPDLLAQRPQLATRENGDNDPGVSMAGLLSHPLFGGMDHGHFEMGAYIAYFEGRLTDRDYDEGEASPRLPAIRSAS